MKRRGFLAALGLAPLALITAKVIERSTSVAGLMPELERVESFSILADKFRMVEPSKERTEFTSTGMNLYDAEGVLRYQLGE